MEDNMENAFKICHDQCLDDWNKAVRSGEIGSLSKYPSSDYQGFFGYKDASNVTATSRDEAIRGLQELLSYVVGSDHRSQDRNIKMRTDREAVVSYERSISRDDSVKMTFLVLQTWRIDNGEWRIVREIAENI
jgi:hypothetical protein